MEPISRMDEIVANLHRLDEYLPSGERETRDGAVSLIRLGQNLVACRCGGRWLLGPSRFVGYRDNTLARHAAFDERHGRDTDRAIRRILGDELLSDELEEQYVEFCGQHGVEPTGHQRHYWIIR